MTSQFKFISKQIGASAVILSSALILSACSTISVPFSGSKVSAENAPVASDTAASEDMDKMRAQCMAMQEKMKANMAAGGSMMSDGMMSDEMKAKHKKCMGAMPEMREEMHKECMGMHKEKMGEGEMMKGDIKKMHDHCMQMMEGDSENDATLEAQPEEGKHQH